MSSTSWTPMWSDRAWTPRPAWRQWRVCRWPQWSTGMSRQGPSGCWRTWWRTGHSECCWPRCWRSSGSSWARRTPPWAAHWRPSCSRFQPSPTTSRSCCGWRAVGRPVRRELSRPRHPPSASLRGSCVACECCGSWPSGHSGPRGTCGNSPRPARAAAQPPARPTALEGGCRAGVPPGGSQGPAGPPLWRGCARSGADGRDRVTHPHTYDAVPLSLWGNRRWPHFSLAEAGILRWGDL